MRFLRHSLTGLFLLSVTIGLLVYAGGLIYGAAQDRAGQDGRRPGGREREFTVAVVEAQMETITPILQAFGQVESRRSLVLRAASGGPILSLSPNFQEGGTVKAGEVLAQIDPWEAESSLARRQADLSDAQAEQRDALRGLDLSRDELAAAEEQTRLRQQAFERQTDLAARGVATAASVEAAELSAASARQSVVTRRASVAGAEARVDRAATALVRAEIALQEAQRAVDDTVIRASFAGTLSDVSVVVGDLVSSNAELATLVDATALDVAFRVSTAQYARLLDPAGGLRKADVTARLDVGGIDLSSPGQISRDSAAVGEGQTGRVVFATLLQPRGMKPGDFVTIEIEEPPLDRVVRLPSKALGSDGSILFVNEDSRLAALPVTLLRRQGDDVLVRAREVSGKQVVAERTPLLGVGIRVKALSADRDPSAPPPEPEMVELTDERRAKLVAFVESNTRMPAPVKQRMLGALKEPTVSASIVNRLESRMGG